MAIKQVQINYNKFCIYLPLRIIYKFQIPRYQKMRKVYSKHTNILCKTRRSRFCRVLALANLYFHFKTIITAVACAQKMFWQIRIDAEDEAQDDRFSVHTESVIKSCLIHGIAMHLTCNAQDSIPRKVFCIASQFSHLKPMSRCRENFHFMITKLAVAETICAENRNDETRQML